MAKAKADPMTLPDTIEAHDDVLPQGYYCGARTRTESNGSDGTCTQRAGWGTDHPGIGRCKLHGGASPVKHGLYSAVTNHRLSDRLAQLREDEERLLDLREQIALQTAVIQEYLAGLTESETLAAEEAKTLAGLVETVSRNIERFHKVEQGGVLGAADLQIVINQFVAIVSAETDQETAAKIGRRLLAGLGEDGRAA